MGATCIGFINSSGPNAAGGISLRSGNTYFFTVSSYPVQCINNFMLSITNSANTISNCGGEPMCPLYSPVPADSYESAVLFDNHSICGNTSKNYSPINSQGEDENETQLRQVFCDSIENNSWIKFIASETSATFNVYVCNCSYGYGIEIAVYSNSDYQTFYPHSICWSPGNMENTTITATGLTVGNSYYIMIDGKGGDVCSYTLTGVSGINCVEAIISETGTPYGTICQFGDSLHLQAIGGTLYSWNPILGLSNSNIPNPIASPTSSTTYTCTISGGALTQNISKSVTIAVVTSLTANVDTCSANTNTYKLSGSLTFNVKPSKGFITFSNNEGISRTYNAPFNNPLNYEITGLNSNGQSNTITASYTNTNHCFLSQTYLAPPQCVSCSSFAGNDSIACGLSTNLNALGSISNQSQQWQCSTPGVTFENSNQANTLVRVSEYGTYTFTWIVVNNSGETCVNQVNINFIENPTSTFTVSSPLCENSPVEIAYTGERAETFNWQFNGGIPSVAIGEGPHTVYFPSGNHNIQLSTVSAEGCNSVFNQMPINVNTAPPSNFSAQTPVCALESSIISINFPHNSTYSYTWNVNPTATPSTISGIGPHNLIWSNSTNASVSLTTYNNTTGCSSSTTAIIQVVPAGTPNCCITPNPNAGSDVNNTCELNYTLNASTPTIGNTSTWSQIAGPGTSVFSNIHSPNCQVVVSDAGTYTFQWEEVSGTCVASSQVNITFSYNEINACFSCNTNWCGTNALLSALPIGVNMINGSWSTNETGINISNQNTHNTYVTINNPSQFFNNLASKSVNFYWTTTSNNLCINQDSVLITFHQIPNADVGADEEICGNEYSFTGNNSFIGSSCSWIIHTKPNTYSNAVFTPNNSPNSTVVVSDYGTYSFVLIETNSDNTNCADRDTVTILFKIIPQTPSVTHNGNILISDIALGNQWHDTQGPIFGETNQTFTPSETGSYYTVIEENGCFSENSNSVFVVITSKQNLNSESVFAIYPNPTNQDITIELKSKSNNVNYQIFGSDGRLICEGNIIKNKTQISLNHLSPGLYTISVSSGGNVGNQKFVILNK